VQRGSDALLSVLAIFSLALAVYSIRLTGRFVADDHFIFYRLQQGGATRGTRYCGARGCWA